MGILIYIAVLYLLTCYTLAPLFAKAGVESKKAWIPGINFLEWCQLIGKPKWWSLLLLLPIVNIFIFTGMAVYLVRSFGRLHFSSTFWAVIYAPIEFYLTNKDPKAKYVGQIIPIQKEYKKELENAQKEYENNINSVQKEKYKRQLSKLIHNNPYKKSTVREWTESIVFAVFAAAFIRMFLVEAFVIPTSSMEGSLLVGDFLFVSKVSYGIRTPETIAMLPLLHNRIPKLNKESYLEHPKLKSIRLPALREIKRFDPVVFNYPEGDSVIITPGRTFGVYDFKRMNMSIPKNAEIITRPLDKRDFYIKRCIGLPGEKLEIKNREVYINNEKIKTPDNAQFTYRVTSLSGPVNQDRLDKIGVNINDIPNNQNVYYNLTDNNVKTIESWGEYITVEYQEPRHRPGHLFPHDEKNWPNQTFDNFGPIHIPKKGETVELTPQNIAQYRRIINVYEDNTIIENQDGTFTINGNKSNSYTFKQNYYFMMGDNRHNSEDSRVWGFVPHDHITGRPLFIWMSLKNAKLTDGIRWNRIFKSASK